MSKNGKNQHVLPTPDGNWAVKGESNKRITRKTRTKKEAEDIARQIARNQKSDVVIHGKDGKIQDRDSYGSDPCPPKDKRH